MKKILPILAVAAAAWVYFSRKPAPPAVRTPPPVSTSNPGTGNDPNVLSSLFNAFKSQKTPNNAQPQLSGYITAGSALLTASASLVKAFGSPSTSSPAVAPAANPVAVDSPAASSNGYGYNDGYFD